MNFVDTAVYKGIWFETKPTLILEKILNPPFNISIFGPH